MPYSGTKWQPNSPVGTSINVTASFMPDGTVIAGSNPSNLFATLEAKYATALWQYQFVRALTSWAQATPLTFNIVQDRGLAAGTAGSAQSAGTAITGATNASPIVITSAAHGLTTGDKVSIIGVLGNTAANGRWTVTVVNSSTFSLTASTGNGNYTSGGVALYFGDVRFGAYPDSAGTWLGFTNYPFQFTTNGGDPIINSYFSYNIGTNYDLYSVLLHEIGHAIGLDHSTVYGAVMYPYILGVYAGLTHDDVYWAQTAYGPRTDFAETLVTVDGVAYAGGSTPTTGPTVLWLDHFTGTNGAQVYLHTPDVGTTSRNVVETYIASVYQMVISNNRATLTSPSSVGQCRFAPTGYVAGAVTISCKFLFSVSANLPYFGVLLYLRKDSSASNSSLTTGVGLTALVARVYPGTGGPHLQILSYSSGVEVVLANRIVAVPVNTINTFSFTDNAGTFTAKLNGYSVTATSSVGSANVGCMLEVSTGPYPAFWIDDLTVTTP